MRAVFVVLGICGCALSAKGEALKPWLAMPGKVVVQDDFEDASKVTERWFFKEHWTIEKGVLVRTEIVGENQRVFVKKPRYGDCFIGLRFAFQGAQEIRVMTGTPGKYNAVVTLWPNGFRVSTARDETIPHFPTVLGECAFDFKEGEFYPLAIEIVGEEIVVRIDDDHAITGTHPILKRTRDYFAFQVDQSGAAFDDVVLQSGGSQMEGWKARQKKLLAIQKERLWLPHSEKEQQKVREQIARDRLFRADPGFKRRVTQIEVLRGLAKKQFPEAYLTLKERKKAVVTERKRLLREDPLFKKLNDAVSKLRRSEVRLLHVLHPELEKEPPETYHLALARARKKSAEAQAYQLLMTNLQVTEARLAVRYPQVVISDEQLMEKTKAAKAKAAADPIFQELNKTIATAVKIEKDVVQRAAKSGPKFAQPKDKE